MKTSSIQDGDRTASPTNDQLGQMKFLECCIKEALRIMPSVPMIERVVTEPLIVSLLIG